MRHSVTKKRGRDWRWQQARIRLDHCLDSFKCGRGGIRKEKIGS